MTPVERLTVWVQRKHEGQVIKGTEDLYFKHVTAVAEMAEPLVKWGYEIGLCHDLLEDTPTSESELLEALIGFGYTDADAGFIAACVTELTDVFTAGAYPRLSKKARKEKEATRLVTISPAAQTVKYCDLADNIRWVLQHDQKHALQYLRKKQLLLAGMLSGDKGMRQKVLDLIDNGLKALIRADA